MPVNLAVKPDLTRYRCGRGDLDGSGDAAGTPHAQAGHAMRGDVGHGEVRRQDVGYYAYAYQRIRDDGVLGDD